LIDALYGWRACRIEWTEKNPSARCPGCGATVRLNSDSAVTACDECGRQWMFAAWIPQWDGVCFFGKSYGERLINRLSDESLQVEVTGTQRL